MPHEAQAARADAVVFNGCFGWLHMPEGPVRASGVVLCNPLGAAAVGTHRNWRQFAVRLAEAGFPTLRFDYPATGDSAEPEDGDLIEAWIGSIVAAMAWLKAHTGVEEVALCGLCFGALLAAEAAAASPGAATRLVLLAPPASGEAYLRELKIAASTRDLAQPDDGGLEAEGLWLSAGQCARLEAMQLARALPAARPRCLLVLQPGWHAAQTTRLTFALRGSGISVVQAAFIGYRAFMQQAYKARAPEETFQKVIEFLDAAGAGTCPPLALPPPRLCLPGALTEAGFCFGADAGLFGIGCLPPSPVPGAPAALIVNTGVEPHTGHGRLAVLLSRRLAGLGMAAFRMDITGCGDSARAALEPAPGAAFTEEQRAWLRVFRPEFVDDVVTAIEELGRRGFGSCLVIGLCSGANLALHAALKINSIAGIVVVNPALTDRGKNSFSPEPPETWQTRLRHAVGQRLAARYRDGLHMLRLDARCLLAKFFRAPALLDARSRWFWFLRAKRMTLLAICSEGDDSIREWRRYAGRLWPDAGGAAAGMPLIIRGHSHSFESLAMREDLIETIAAHVVKHHLPAACATQTIATTAAAQEMDAGPLRTALVPEKTGG